MFIAVAFLFMAAIRRPVSAIDFGWFGLFWWALDVLVTALVSYGH
jgi:hypothetical protein